MKYRGAFEILNMQLIRLRVQLSDLFCLKKGKQEEKAHACFGHHHILLFCLIHLSLSLISVSLFFSLSPSLFLVYFYISLLFYLYELETP
jgi:hypothetical protein